jgi:hypothetical protein
VKSFILIALGFMFGMLVGSGGNSTITREPINIPFRGQPSEKSAAIMTIENDGSISIATSKGPIVIKSGQVIIPEGASISDASQQFWIAVAKGFPEARQAIIKSHPKE